MSDFVRRKRIPLSEPCLYGNEKEWILKCLETNWVSSSGPFVEQFENEIASAVHAPHGKSVATASGTAALHLALISAGVGASDLVIVPTLTFIATVNAVTYTGAEPVFFGCDSRLCLDLNAVENFVATECSTIGDKIIHKKSGKRVAAVVPVHVLGFSVDIFRLRAILGNARVAIVEDAAESMGSLVRSKDNDEWINSGTLGDVGCYSFNGNKIVTSGGGGALVSNHQDWIHNCRYLANQAKDDNLFFEHHNVGYNYRITSLEAALGIAQIKNLAHSIELRRKIHSRYSENFKNHRRLVLLQGAANERPNHWLSAVRIEGRTLDHLRRGISQLQEMGIEGRPLWKLNHLQLPYQSKMTHQVHTAEDLYPQILCLPSTSNLSTQEVDYVSECVVRILNN